MLALNNLPTSELIIPKFLLPRNVAVCHRQNLHCVSDENLGDSDSGQYSGFLNARLHTITTNLQHKHQTKPWPSVAFVKIYTSV